MNSLHTHQRGLLERVDPSPGLSVARRTALFWHKFQLGTQCKYTSLLLKRFGCLDELVENYFNRSATSTFAEEPSTGFLWSLRTHDDALIRAVSQFERAVLEVKAGRAKGFVILWDRDPDLVFAALEAQHELPPPEGQRGYRMQIYREHNGLVAYSRGEEVAFN
jgi:hypothetical protein